MHDEPTPPRNDRPDGWWWSAAILVLAIAAALAVTARCLAESRRAADERQAEVLRKLDAVQAWIDRAPYADVARAQVDIRDDIAGIRRQSDGRGATNYAYVLARLNTIEKRIEELQLRGSPLAASQVGR
jgi:hypothetical protein